MKASSRFLVFGVCAVLCGRVFSIQAGQPHKIAILPITTGGQENISYITDGLRDMIASRVASGSDLVLIEQAAVKARYSGGGKEPPSVDKVRNLGKSLGADYVIFGSAASIGSGLMIAVNLLSVSGEAAPIPVFAQTLGIDEVIPRMQLIAREVRDAVADGVLIPEDDLPPVTSPEEPPAQKNEEDAEAVAGGSAGPLQLMENEESGTPGDFEERPVSIETDDADREEKGDETADEKDEGGGLEERLFKRKGDVKAPPENPVYEKSVDELQDAAKPQPEAD